MIFGIGEGELTVTGIWYATTEIFGQRTTAKIDIEYFKQRIHNQSKKDLSASE